MMMQELGNTMKAAIAAALVLAAAISPAQAQSSVTYASWGGITQDAIVTKLFDGAAKLGLQIRNERSGAWSGIKAHLNAGAPGWDLTDTGLGRCEEASLAEKLSPIDYAIVDKKKAPAHLTRRDYVGVFTFSYGIAYQTKKYGANGPKSWADFYDAKKFPGSRSMLGDGLYALETALVADGVPLKNVYKVLMAPGGVDRAFKKLDQIKPHVKVWWTSTGQAMQLMRDGEVDMAIFPNGRALALVKDGTPITYVWNEGFIDVACYIVPKTAANPKGAFQLINLALDAGNQARFAATIGYGPVNPEAFKTGILSKDQMDWLPTSPQNVDRQAWVDPAWSASQQAQDAMLRFSKFLQVK